jgi:hypothetical protein
MGSMTTPDDNRDNNRDNNLDCDQMITPDNNPNDNPDTVTSPAETKMIKPIDNA